MLALSSDRGETIWHSQRTLAQRCGWDDDRTVRTYLDELREGGWVDTGHRWRRDKASGHVVAMSNMTRPLVPAELETAWKARRAQSTPTKPGGGVQHGSSARQPAVPVVIVEHDRPEAQTPLGKELATRALRLARRGSSPP
jgi:hypothetical protein